jgi:hypothetical protein
VVLLGDSQALALQTQLDPADAPGLDVRLVTEFGCGLIPYDSAIGDEKVVVEDKCHDWTPAAIEGKVREAGGRIGVMMAGTWEQYDRWRPEAPLRYTDPEWSADLEAEYRRRLEILGRSTDSVALILNHCHGAPDMGLPLQITFQAGRYPDVVNDPRRIAAVNDAARAAAAEVDFPVKIIDLNPLLCADGYTEKLDGVQLRSDGLHFTVEGAAIVWRYLAPILTGMAATG